MRGTYLVTFYKDKSGLFRWRLQKANNRIVADSGEGYSSVWNARRAFDTMRKVLKSTTRMRTAIEM